MAATKFKIFPLGDSALTVEFGKTISPHLNRLAIGLSKFFESNPFPGFVESVPAYASATLFYDIVQVRRAFPEFETAFETVKTIAADAVENAASEPDKSGITVEIPVDFGGESALDLEFVAANAGVTPDEVIDIFTAREYRVFMLGFLPGFSYMGEVNDRIATPRKQSPRLAIPKGSVGIAGKQAGIYSLESPGGWQILGRTDVELFTPNGKTPSLLQSGDSVKFVSIR